MWAWVLIDDFLLSRILTTRRCWTQWNDQHSSLTDVKCWTTLPWSNWASTLKQSERDLPAMLFWELLVGIYRLVVFLIMAVILLCLKKSIFLSLTVMLSFDYLYDIQIIFIYAVNLVLQLFYTISSCSCIYIVLHVWKCFVWLLESFVDFLVMHMHVFLWILMTCKSTCI